MLSIAQGWKISAIACFSAGSMAVTGFLMTAHPPKAKSKPTIMIDYEGARYDANWCITNKMPHMKDDIETTVDAANQTLKVSLTIKYIHPANEFSPNKIGYKGVATIAGLFNTLQITKHYREHRLVNDAVISFNYAEEPHRLRLGYRAWQAENCIFWAMKVNNQFFGMRN